MHALLGDDHSWCTFAVWASSTAGVSIRGQELPNFAADLLSGAAPHVAAIEATANRRLRFLRWTGLVRLFEATHIDRFVDAAVATVSTHIAHGNTLVYSELAPLFVGFLEGFEAPGTSDQI